MSTEYSHAPSERKPLGSASSHKFELFEIIAKMEPIMELEEMNYGPPVDFSFRDLRKVADACKCDPREGPHKYITIPVEGFDLPVVEDTKEKGAKPPSGTDSANDEKKQYVKYLSKAIRLSNNSLSSLDKFTTGVQAIIQSPSLIEWIDLSFNDLTKIDDALLEFPNLKVLYMHANYIDDVKQINKLAGLPHLKTLTLHGNMIEGKKGYRQYVLTTLPQLQYFDFSRITKADRDKATVWKKLKLIELGASKKKKKEETVVAAPQE